MLVHFLQSRSAPSYLGCLRCAPCFASTMSYQRIYRDPLLTAPAPSRKPFGTTNRSPSLKTAPAPAPPSPSPAELSSNKRPVAFVQADRGSSDRTTAGFDQAAQRGVADCDDRGRFDASQRSTVTPTANQSGRAGRTTTTPRRRPIRRTSSGRRRALAYRYAHDGQQTCNKKER